MKSIVLIVFVFCSYGNFAIAQNGCTDISAKNYDAKAMKNDGSCLYDSTSVTPLLSIKLDTILDETSGLIEWNNFLYTHNDDTETAIYKLDKTNGNVIQKIQLNGVTNIDWEEISQDENYIYIGDFGNNYKGNRTDLKIYKIEKNTLETNPKIEIINFSYSNQTNFEVQKANKTDFDCEAFVVTSNEILLFTKQWISNKTSVYSLPKTAGTYLANFQTTLDVNGLITGATLKEDSKFIALCGYSKILHPFIYLIYDFNETDFLVANKRKINLKLPFHQIEGIATNNGLDYYLSNELFSRKPFINNTQKLHCFSLSKYVFSYFNTHNTIVNELETKMIK